MGVLALKGRVVSLTEQAPKDEEPKNQVEVEAAPAKVSNGVFKPLLAESYNTIQVICRALVLIVFTPLKALARYIIHYPLHAVLLAVMCVAFAGAILTGVAVHRQVILSRISEHTIDEVINASSFQREYSADEMRRNGIRAFVNVGAPVWAQREAVRAILAQARLAGLDIEDQAILLAIADIESGFNPLAQAQTTTACGLFQFVQRTGESFSLSVSECMDPWKNARAEVEHYISNYDHRVKSQVQDLVGAEKVLRTFELSYYLHHDGPNSENPSNDLKALVLSGSHFLLKAYQILQEDNASKIVEPSYGEKYLDTLLNLVKGNFR